MSAAYLLSAANTPFGRFPKLSAMDLMATAANGAIAAAGVDRREIDGVLCGYATTFPHLMLGTLLSEKLGLDPHYAHGVQMGGATGAAMLMLAADAAADPGIHLVDIATPFEQLAASDRAAFDRLSIDGIHLTPAGYAAWLEVLRPVLDAVVGPSEPARPAEQGLRAGERMLLDLGADDGAVGLPTGVDEAGHHWNDWWSTAPGGDVLAGEHRGSLVTAEGRATGVAMTVTGGFRASTVAEAGPVAPDPAALGDLAVHSATRDAWIATADDRPGGDDDLPGGFLLEGLDPDLRYGLRAVGASPGAPRSTAELVVHGASGGTAQLRTGGQGAGRETAAIGDLVPDARGRLWVDVRVVQGAAVSLNAVELVAAEPVQP